MTENQSETKIVNRQRANRPPRPRSRPETIEYFNTHIKTLSINDRQTIIDKICVHIGKERVQISGNSSIIKGDFISDSLLEEIINLLDQYIKNDLIDFSDVV